MSFVGKNIRKLRTVKKLSQASFAELFGLARPSVGAYEEGRSEPKMETLIQIAQYFGLSVDLLLTKELTVNELYHFDIFQEQLAAPVAPNTPSIADALADVTPYVAGNRSLEYIVNHHDPTFIDSLPWVKLPHQFSGLTRAFEIRGAEMQLPKQRGLRHKDLVLCTRVSKAEPALQVGGIYVFVTQGKMLVRRVAQKLAEGQRLYLKADNADYSSQEFELAQALEIWEVKGVFTTHLRPPAPAAPQLAALGQPRAHRAARVEGKG
ncbi:MAG: LexA family transcriptional regulator [Hymenobacter sp.]|nr:MAG: LexA family transcriptional regulator [Hymenobacter sp.]